MEEFATKVNRFREALSIPQKRLLDRMFEHEKAGKLVVGGSDGLTVVVTRDGQVHVIPHWNPARRIPGTVTRFRIAPRH